MTQIGVLTVTLSVSYKVTQTTPTITNPHGESCIKEKYPCHSGKCKSNVDPVHMRIITLSVSCEEDMQSL